MKCLNCLLLVFLLPVQAFALESMSFIHSLGTHGDLGHESLQLLCVKERCHLSFSENDRVTSKKEFKRSEVKNFFEIAQTAVNSPRRKDEATTSTHFI